jgi:hypothetical protein
MSRLVAAATLIACGVGVGAGSCACVGVAARLGAGVAWAAVAETLGIGVLVVIAVGVAVADAAGVVVGLMEGIADGWVPTQPDRDAIKITKAKINAMLRFMNSVSLYMLDQ